MITPDIILVLALGVLILVMFTNNRKRRKQAQELVNSLKVGDQVLLHSGIFGKVTELEEDRLTIETAPKVKLTVIKQAVRSVEANQEEKNEEA
ncbi:MAG: preprotein translocase subunit YajC [Microbacteriaceae bacterium]|nr:preprotein translocase subunit YajC [Microbacteriaceae bacterium]MDR9443503.1 preprotein translocase subunit YajC [Microbacteriaceae bacterium]